MLCPYLGPEYCDELDKMLNEQEDIARLDKLQQLVFHLQSNPDIAIEVPEPSKLFNLSDAELVAFIDIAAETKHAEKITKYQNLVATMFDNTSNTSVLYCKYCKVGEVEWSVKQTRSADEGSTVYCYCKGCRMRWRM